MPLAVHIENIMREDTLSHELADDPHRPQALWAHGLTFWATHLNTIEIQAPPSWDISDYLAHITQQGWRYANDLHIVFPSAKLQENNRIMLKLIAFAAIPLDFCETTWTAGITSVRFEFQVTETADPHAVLSEPAIAREFLA